MTDENRLNLEMLLPWVWKSTIHVKT